MISNRTTCRFIAFLPFMLAAVATQAAELRPGMTLAGRVSPGAADTQHFHAGAKQFVHLSVDQGETDLAIAVIAPGGRKIADRDGRERGPESVSFITEVAGEYALEVRALAPSAAVYHVTLDNPRAPQSGDEVRIRAEEASSAGNSSPPLPMPIRRRAVWPGSARPWTFGARSAIRSRNRPPGRQSAISSMILTSMKKPAMTTFPLWGSTSEGATGELRPNP